MFCCFLTICSCNIYNSRIVFNELVCTVEQCDFISISNSLDGSSMYYSNSLGNVSISHSSFQNCINNAGVGVSATFYVIGKSFLSICNSVFQTKAYDAPSGYASSATFNNHSHFSVSFVSGSYRGLFADQGRINENQLNISNFDLKTSGAFIRLNPSLECSIYRTNIVHSKGACVLAFYGTLNDPHNVQLMNCYNITSSLDGQVLVSTAGTILLNNCYLCNYRPLSLFNVASSSIPKISNSFLEQSSVSASYDAGGNSFGICITYGIEATFYQCQINILTKVMSKKSPSIFIVFYLNLYTTVPI